MKKIILIWFLAGMLLFSCNQDGKERSSVNQPLKVEIKKEGNGFQLFINNEPSFIKGARTIGTKYMDKVAEYGGNAVRIGYRDNVGEVMDEAHRLGLTVLFGLHVQAERNGFD